MTDVIDDEKAVVDLDTVRPRPALSDATNDELVRLLAERARAEGLRLAGEGGLLSQLTKRVVESASTGSSTTISATASTIRPAATAATRETASAGRPC